MNNDNNDPNNLNIPVTTNNHNDDSANIPEENIHLENKEIELEEKQKKILNNKFSPIIYKRNEAT